MEIIGLVETWEMKKEKWEIEFEDFEWRSIEATKEHKKGRAKGGICLAVKESKDRKIVEWKQGESREILGVKLNWRKEMWLVMVVYMNKEKEINYETMRKWLEEDPGLKVIIGGDFNARTGVGGM